MNEMPLMACGHVARSFHTNEHDGLGESHPSCVVCFMVPGDRSCQVAENLPSLEGRMARCGYQNKKDGSPHEPVPSSYNLAFFEYKGEGSTAAQERCKHCPYTLNAHRFFPYYNPGRCPGCNRDGLYHAGNAIFKCVGCDEEFHAAKVRAKHNPTIENHEFEPHGPFEYDQYYCGCWGWD